MITSDTKIKEKPKLKSTKKKAGESIAAPVVVVPEEPTESTEEMIGEGEPQFRDDDKAFGKRGERYFEAVGRRKTAIARVRIFTKPGDFTINNRLHSLYFPTLVLQKVVEDALQKMNLFGRFRVSIMVHGGGIHSQAEAARHGLSRALTKFNPDFRKRLKRAGFLRRDDRMKERKKFGLKKARKAPQW